MAPSSRHLVRLAAHQRQAAAVAATPCARRTFAASASPCASPSASTSAEAASSSSRHSRRSARFSQRPGADLVGPPDPLSNLRPIKYGSAFEDVPSGRGDSGSGSAGSASAAMSLTHPYSLNEFNQGSSSSSAARRGHSQYFERLLERLDEAELAHKLRMARADNFNQRFWQDNNARFIQALNDFRSRTTSSKAVATLKTGGKDKSDAPAASAINTNAQESELDIDSDMLATFYSAWLKANATRHRAYNRQLWTQTFGDLAPALRYQMLRTWAKVVGSFERQIGRH